MLLFLFQSISFSRLTTISIAWSFHCPIKSHSFWFFNYIHVSSLANWWNFFQIKLWESCYILRLFHQAFYDYPNSRVSHYYH